MRTGDWSAAVWYDPVLAEASWELEDMTGREAWGRLEDLGRIYTTKEIVGKNKWAMQDSPDEAEVAVAKQAGKDGYTCVAGYADAWAKRAERHQDNPRVLANLTSKTGHLLITNSQDSASARLTAFASDEALVGYTWTPVQDATPQEAKALAIWLNSTPGRIAMRRVISRKLTWPMWQPAALMKITIPNIRSKEGKERMAVLCEGYETLKGNELELYRDGYTSTRQSIDQIVADATDLSFDKLSDWGRRLAEEPTIKQGKTDTE